MGRKSPHLGWANHQIVERLEPTCFASGSFKAEDGANSMTWWTFPIRCLCRPKTRFGCRHQHAKPRHDFHNGACKLVPYISRNIRRLHACMLRTEQLLMEDVCRNVTVVQRRFATQHRRPYCIWSLNHVKPDSGRRVRRHCNTSRVRYTTPYTCGTHAVYVGIRRPQGIRRVDGSFDPWWVIGRTQFHLRPPGSVVDCVIGGSW